MSRLNDILQKIREPQRVAIDINNGYLNERDFITAMEELGLNTTIQFAKPWRQAKKLILAGSSNE